MGVWGLPPFITLLVKFYISLKFPAIIKYGGSRIGNVKIAPSFPIHQSIGIAMVTTTDNRLSETMVEKPWQTNMIQVSSLRK